MALNYFLLKKRHINFQESEALEGNKVIWLLFQEHTTTKLKKHLYLVSPNPKTRGSPMPLREDISKDNSCFLAILEVCHIILMRAGVNKEKVGVDTNLC